MQYFNPQVLGQPLGMYSHVSESPAGRVLCVAGQVGMDQAGKVTGEELEPQLRQAIANVAAALADRGASLRDIAMMNTFLIEAEDIPRFMDARSRVFPDFFGDEPYPPNTLLVVSRLVDPRLRIEVQAMAISAVAVT